MRMEHACSLFSAGFANGEGGADTILPGGHITETVVWNIFSYVPLYALTCCLVNTAAQRYYWFKFILGLWNCHIE